MTGRTSRHRGGGRALAAVRRTGVGLSLGLVAAIQMLGYRITPYTLPSVATLEPPGSPLAPRDDRATSNASAQCLQYFPGYVPAVASPGRQRALCFDSFAVLHSGQS